MNIFKKLNAFLRGGTTGFCPLEEKVLEAIIGKLDSVRAEKLRQRVCRINFVQRLDGGREVNTYEMQGGKPVVDPSLRLIDDPGEKALAKFSFATMSDAKNSGKLWLVDGRFFSLEFKDPTEHMLDDDLKSIEIEIAT